MSKTREDLLKEFQEHIDADDTAGGQNAIRMIFEVLVDIRDGVIKMNDDKNT